MQTIAHPPPMHATGKSSTLGVSSIVLASFVYFTFSEAGVSIKELLTIVLWRTRDALFSGSCALP